MSFKSVGLFICVLLVQTSLKAQENLPSNTVKSAEPSLQKHISLDTELSLEYRSDRLREQQNSETTNIRNLSILVNLFENEDSKLVFEILGEENQLGDLNVNVGELYYAQKLSAFKTKDSQFKVGVMKLGYGVLNDLDGLFAVLPSYYGYLYDLPRGLDTGIELSTQLFIPELILSGSVFAGKNLRQTDSKNREIDVVPHHLKLTWSPNGQHGQRLGLNYFSRKYEGQPLISGFGLEYYLNRLIFFKGLSLDLVMEAWSINASLNSVNNKGLAALIAPKISYKKLFFQPYISLENWGQPGTQSSSELFYTGKLGYVFNKNFQFLLEQTQIFNTSTDIEKENSIQARVVSQWQF